MYSTYGDTVLDPFWGTGTTSLAALVAARNSIGYERNAAFIEVFGDRIEVVPRLSREVGEERLADHQEFVAEQRAAGGEVKYEAANYDTAVKNKREREIQLYSVEEVEGTGAKDERQYVATHRPLKQNW
jgi:tRNA G10  N-methylase Trm11